MEELPITPLNRDSLGQYSLTLHPSLIPIEYKIKRERLSPKVHRIRTVSIRLSKESYTTDDDTDNRAHCIIYPHTIFRQGITAGFQWQVVMSSADPLKASEFPSRGTLVVTLQHKDYYGNYEAKDIEKSSNATENCTLLVSIKDDRLQSHPVFTHIRLLLDDTKKRVEKVFLAGNCKTEDEILHNAVLEDTELDITEQIRNTAISKRSYEPNSDSKPQTLKKIKSFRNEEASSLYIDI